MPGTDTITMYRGEDATITFTMSPVEDITGWAVEFNVRDSTGVIIQVSGSIDDGPNGVFSFNLADTLTDSLTPGRYKYDAWRIDAGAEFVLARGDFKLRDVSRDVTV